MGWIDVSENQSFFVNVFSLTCVDAWRLSMARHAFLLTVGRVKMYRNYRFLRCILVANVFSSFTSVNVVAFRMKVAASLAYSKKGVSLKRPRLMSV